MVMVSLIKASILAAGGNIREARDVFENSMKMLAGVKDMNGLKQINDVCQAAMFRIGLAESQITVSSNTYFKRYAKVLNEINLALKSEQLTEIVHHIALSVNDFQL